MPNSGIAVVVDDDESIRHAVREMVEGIVDYEVDVASDGEQLLRLMRSKAVRLLVLDLMMPNVDGYEVLSHLRRGAVPRPERIVVMSAHADPMSRSEIVGLGADEYLPKPFSLAQLEKAINNK